MRAGRRRRRNGLENNSAQHPDDPAANSLPPAATTLLEDLEYTRLLVDERAWDIAGSELRRRDPARYVAILKIVEEICSIHRAPLEPISVPGTFVVPQSNGGDFD